MASPPHGRVRRRHLDYSGSVFVEGGGGLAASFVRDDLVDRLSLFYAPLLLGEGALSPFVGVEVESLMEARRWRHLRTAAFGIDTLITLARNH